MRRTRCRFQRHRACHCRSSLPGMPCTHAHFLICIARCCVAQGVDPRGIVFATARVAPRRPPGAPRSDRAGGWSSEGSSGGFLRGFLWGDPLGGSSGGSSEGSSGGFLRGFLWGDPLGGSSGGSSEGSSGGFLRGFLWGDPLGGSSGGSSKGSSGGFLRGFLCGDPLEGSSGGSSEGSSGGFLRGFLWGGS